MDIEQVSYTKFRMHLASFMNGVAKSHLPIRIVRRDNEPAYLISKEMYEYLVKQSSNKSKTNKNTESAFKKKERVQQKPAQITTALQQDLFENIQ